MTTFNRFGGGTANLPLGTLKRVIIPAAGASTLAQEENYETIRENGLWVKENAVYLQSEYPALFNAIGLINGANFTPRDTGTTNNLSSVAYGNDYWVAGTSQTLRLHLSSTDGATWTANAAAGVTTAGIAYGNSVYVVAGHWGAATSTDASRGSFSLSTTTVRFVNGIIFGNGLFVTVASSGYIQYSADGITWTEIRPDTASLTAVDHHDDIFVASGASAKVVTSTDGVNWTAQTLGSVTANSFLSLTHDTEDFIMVSNNGGEAIGEPVTTRTEVFDTPGTHSWTCPAGVTSVYVVCVGGGGGGVQLSSSTHHTGSGGGGLGWKNVTVTPGETYTVVVGNGGVGGGATGADGEGSYFINDTTVAGFGGQGALRGSQDLRLGGTFVGDGGGNGGNGGITTGTQNFRSGGAGGAGGYSGPGGNGGTVTTSIIYSDIFGQGGGAGGSIGGSFGSGSANMGPGGGVGVFGQGASGLVVMTQFSGGGDGGSGGTVGTVSAAGRYGGGGQNNNTTQSRDGASGAVGISYTVENTERILWKNLLNDYAGGTGTITNSIRADDKILSIHSGYIQTTYSNYFSYFRNSVYPTTINSVGYGNGLYLIGGTAGVILRSTDLNSWQSTVAASTNTVTALTYGAGLYVAGFTSGVINTSTDAITWTTRTSGTTSTIERIIFENNLFVRAGWNGQLGTSTNGITWTARTSGTTSTLYALAWGNNVYAYGGNAGVIRSSTDGTTWTARTSGTTNTIRDMTFGSNVGKFLAVGNNGLISTSTDAITWVTQTISTITNRIYYNASYDNGNFYISGDTGLHVTSTDLETWYFIGTPISAAYGNPNVINYANGLYVIGTSTGYLSTSTDKILWSVPTRPATSTINSIEYSNGVWSIAGAAGILGTSTDLVNWYHEITDNRNITNTVFKSNIINDKIYYSAVDSLVQVFEIQDQFTPYNYNTAENIFAQENNFHTNQAINQIIYADNNFIAVANNEVMRQSTDGKNWYTIGANDFGNIRGVAYGNGIYVAVNSNLSHAVSTDGYNWKSYGTGLIYRKMKLVNGKIAIATTTGLEIADPTDPYNYRAHAVGNLYAVAFGNGIYVAVGAAGFVATSSDTYQWTTRTSGTASILQSIIFANNLFVAVGDAGTIRTSTDGITWDARISGATSALNGVTYGNDLYAVAGSGGFIRTSTDAITWDARTSGTTVVLNEIKWLNDQFVAVGASGTIRTSTDGTTWNARTSGTASTLFDVDYYNGLYVVVGNTGALLNSTDAVTWTAGNSSTTSNLNNVIHSGSSWVYTANNGPVGVSNDGINWNLTSRESFLRVIFGNGLFVASTATGIFTSTDNTNWTNRTTASFNINALAYGNGLYLYAGENGILGTSTDAITWTTRTSGTESNINSIAYSDNLYSYVGDSGLIATSTDGITWQARVSGTVSNLTELNYGNGRHIAVGSSGTLLSSDDLTELEYSPAYDSTTEFFVPDFTEAQSIEKIGGDAKEYFIICGSGTEYNVYPWSDATGFGTRYSTITVSLPTISTGLYFHPSMKAILIGTNTHLPAAVAWDSVSGFGQLYSNPTSALVSSRRFGISKSGNVAVITSNESSGGNYVRAWPFNIDTGFGAPISNVIGSFGTTAFIRLRHKWSPNNDYTVSFGPLNGDGGLAQWDDSVGWNVGGQVAFVSGSNSRENAGGFHPSGTRYITNDVNSSNGTTSFRNRIVPTGSIANSYTMDTGNFAGNITFESLKFSPSGNDIVMASAGGNDSTVRVRAFAYSLNSGITSMYPSPPTQSRPPGAVSDAEFSPEGNAIVMIHATSPFITAVRWTPTVGWGTKYSDPSVIPTAQPVGEVSFGTVTRDPTNFSQANQITYVKAEL
jgi:hypothetical protein